MYKVLTIAGSDSSGGAGIQADLKTMMAHKVYGMSVITCLTAQNTQGVFDILNAPKEFVEKEIDVVFNDIVPDAVKIGMVSVPEIIKAIIKKMEEYKPKYLVVDPVMISTSGYRLLSEEAMDVLINGLMPLADIVTPNLHEANALTGMNISSKEEAEECAVKLRGLGMKNILIKGGHALKGADDLLYTDKCIWIAGERIDNPNTHGTGCTLSSAIACNLAMGYDMETSVRNAKEYVRGAIADKMNLGKGDGPLNHAYNIADDCIVKA